MKKDKYTGEENKHFSPNARRLNLFKTYFVITVLVLFVGNIVVFLVSLRVYLGENYLPEAVADFIVVILNSGIIIALNSGYLKGCTLTALALIISSSRCVRTVCCLSYGLVSYYCL